jgi:predicted esterase
MEGSNPPMVAEYTVNTGKSYYTESLHEMINSYKEEIGAEKVILTGCSNGGYMVMQLGVEYPEEYDGLVMSSEAMLDKNITDEQIEAIKSVPMFFIFAENDPTIDPTLTAEPTIKRLQDAGADHLSVSKTADVHDLSGKWMDDGQPHQYSGHWSWVYLFNNESVDENGVTVFDWMGSLVK